MSQIFRKLAQTVLYFRWPTLLAFIFVTAFFGYSISFLQIDPSTEALFAKDTPDYAFYRNFRDHFGSDQLIAVAIESDYYLTDSNLRLTYILTSTLASDARVDRVTSLTNALDIKHKVLGVRVEPVMQDYFEGGKTLPELRQAVLSNPLLVGNLVSTDGKVGAILVRLKAKGEHRDFLRGYVSDLRGFLNSFRWAGVKFHVAGSPVEQHDLVDALRRDQMFFVPAVSIFLILATFLIYRNLPSVIVAMSIVFVTLLWTFGTIAILGRPLNLVNSLLAPVVMIISVTNAIYLMNLYSELRPHHPNVRETICLTVQYLGVPCFLAIGTIAVGFLSLALNPIPAVQCFGLFAALGTSYAYIVAMLLTPVLLPILPFQGLWKKDGESHFFNRVVVFYLERVEFYLKRPLLIGAVILVVLSFFGISKIRINTNLIKDIPPQSRLATATHFIDQNLAGVYSLGISIEQRDGASLVDVETMKKIDQLAQFMEGMPEITKVNSLALLVKKVHQAREGDPAGFQIPESQDTLQTYVEKMAESNNPDFWSFISHDFRHMRLEARMRAVGTERGRAVERRIWNYVARDLGDGYKVKITGSVVLLGQMAEHLVSDQIRSVGFAFVVILSLIAIFFRSVKMALLAAIPNLIPILGLYGLVGFLGIELSTPVAMISNVALGLVVDASIQFLYRFRHEFEQRRNYLQALHHTYRNMGQALVIATMILVFGFASSIFASFRPTIYFGLLTSLTILFSLLCTLVLLPLVLVLLKPFGPQALFKGQAKQILTAQEVSSIIGA